MRTFDIDTVTRILTDEAVYPLMADDYSQDEMKPRLGEVLIASGVWALHPSPNTLFLLFPRTPTMWEVHTAILPAGRGKGAIEDGKSALRWLFENTVCEKVISLVPTFNRQALLFSRKVGFTVEGVITKSFRKNGALHDQTLVGISKEDTCQ